MKNIKFDDKFPQEKHRYYWKNQIYFTVISKKKIVDIPIECKNNKTIHLRPVPALNYLTSNKPFPKNKNIG